MANVKKSVAPKASKTAKAGAKQGADKVAKTAGDIFGKLKGHFEPKKVDEWQKKWLAVPENRKKYEKITDAPEVVGEEVLGIANDIIDFAQGEEGGKSHLFAKVKGSLGGIFSKAKGAADKAKGAANKAKSTAGKAAKSVKKTK